MSSLRSIAPGPAHQALFTADEILYMRDVVAREFGTRQSPDYVGAQDLGLIPLWQLYIEIQETR